jgi:hypothetical protein
LISLNRKSSSKRRVMTLEDTRKRDAKHQLGHESRARDSEVRSGVNQHAKLRSGASARLMADCGVQAVRHSLEIVILAFATSQRLSTEHRALNKPTSW